MVLTCKYCNKEYKSQSSRSNHIKKYHKSDISQSDLDVKNNKSDISQNDLYIKSELKLNNKYKCNNCNNSYKHFQSRWKHEKKCNIEKTKIEESNKNDINIIKKQLENTLLKLAETQDLLKSIKIHPKSLQKINNNINKGTININNNYIIPLYQQNLKDVLTKSEKLSILNSGNSAHLKLTDLLYKNPEYEKYRNIYITNMSNDLGYIYDAKEMRFIVKNKKDILVDYGHERFSDIELFYLELAEKIPEIKLEKIKEMVKNYFNNDNFKDIKNKEMLISLYNNKINVKKIYNVVNEEEKDIEI